jgi:hypothetical protein
VDLDLEMEFCVLFIGKMQKIDLITAKPHGMPSSLMGFEFFFFITLIANPHISIMER